MNVQELKGLMERAGETTGGRNTPESLRASNGIRAFLKSQFPKDKIVFHVGHFYCSGFVARGDKFVYFAFSDYRYFPNSAYCRTAKNEKDFSGGRNFSCSIEKLIDTILKILYMGG